MSWIKAYEPAMSLGEAEALLAEPGWAIIGGGSRLVARPPEGVHKLVDLMPLGLDRIQESAGELRIEPRVRLQDLAEREDCGGLLKAAILSLSHSENLRNQMTVGGETAWPIAVNELQTALVALDATAHRHERDALPVAEYLAADRRVGIITAITIPLEEEARYAFDKVAPGEGARPLLVLAAAGRVAEGRLADLRLALGNLGPAPQRLRALEQRLAGQTPAELSDLKLVDADLAGLRAEDSPDASVESKRLWAEAMIVRFLDGLAAEAG
jgi:CO/xanthine dehydrogenase FAD-binding subunit